MALRNVSVRLYDWDVGVNVRVQLAVADADSDPDDVAVEAVAVALKLLLGLGVQEPVPDGALPVIVFEDVNVTVYVSVREGLLR